MRFLQAVLVLALAVGVNGIEAGDKKKDIKLDGVWLIEAMVLNGEKVPAEHFDGFEAIIEGDRYKLIQGDKTIEEGTTKADPTKTPMTVESTPTSGEHKGKTSYGIAEATENSIKVHMALEGKQPPKDFTPKEGTMLVIYKRKPAK